MSRTELSRWNRLWSELRASGAPGPCHQRLVTAYGESTRHYHNLQHLEECLTEFDHARAGAQRPSAVEAALWFHDVVYNSRSSTNEEDSAAIAVACLAEANVDPSTVDLVARLVFCTKTHDPAGVPDAEMLIDIDLSVLGQPAERFRDYEEAIRAEYAWVPEPTFALKRAEILAGFLRRPAIYRTEPFRTRYESVARANLEASIARLRAVAP